ncbi:MAG: VOC family protein [Acidobacteriota bacterium]
MAEQNVIERLDEIVDAAIAGRVGAPVPHELAMLAVLATDLRGLPDPQFKQELRRRILPMTTTDAVRTPPGLHTVTPYLVVDGAAKLIAFLEQAFGGVEQARVPRPENAAAIMHAEVLIGDSIIELADANAEYSDRRFELHLYVDDADATYARAIAAGARSLHEPVDQPYGDREGGVADPFGNYWYIATHGKEVRPEGFHTVTPFFHAHGAPAFIDFLKETFDAREASRFTSDEGTILHAVAFIGDSALEIGEAHGEWQPMPAAMHVFVDDADRVYQRALRAGAQSIFAPRDEPYGQRVGGVLDRDGNRWYMATVL